MDPLQLNAALACHLLNQNVVWLSGADAVPTPYIYEPRPIASLSEISEALPQPLPDYSRNWRDCQDVIDAMKGRGFAFELKRDGESLYLGGFGRSGLGMVFAEHEVPTMAICLGALRALGAAGLLDRAAAAG